MSLTLHHTALLNTSASGGSSAILPTALRSGLIAWWEMNSKIGNTIQNAVNPSLYTIISNDLLVSGGMNGNALQSSTFATGLDNHYAAFRIDQDFTWQCWTKRSTQTVTPLFRISTNGLSADLAIKFSNILSAYFLELQHSTFSPQVTAFPVVFTPNVWESVVVTHNANSKIFTVYFNGVQIGTVSYSNLNLFVYSTALFGSDAIFANGLMQKYAYWLRILSPSDVFDLFNNGAGYTI